MAGKQSSHKIARKKGADYARNTANKNIEELRQRLTGTETGKQA